MKKALRNARLSIGYLLVSLPALLIISLFSLALYRLITIPWSELFVHLIICSAILLMVFALIGLFNLGAWIIERED